MDEYVRRSYKYAYADSIEVGRLACLPEPPDLKDFILLDAGRWVFSIIILDSFSKTGILDVSIGSIIYLCLWEWILVRFIILLMRNLMKK